MRQRDFSLLCESLYLLQCSLRFRAASVPLTGTAPNTVKRQLEVVFFLFLSFPSITSLSIQSIGSQCSNQFIFLFFSLLSPVLFVSRLFPWALLHFASSDPADFYLYSLCTHFKGFPILFFHSFVEPTFLLHTKYLINLFPQLFVHQSEKKKKKMLLLSERLFRHSPCFTFHFLTYNASPILEARYLFNPFSSNLDV